MSKYEDLKELMILLPILIINMGISYMITFALGIQNHILFISYTALVGTISYETIIFLSISFLEFWIYDTKIKKLKE